MIPPEDYYQEAAPEYILGDRRHTYQSPHVVLDEFYTPDGKLVSTAPAAAERTGSRYSDPRLMIKY